MTNLLTKKICSLSFTWKYRGINRFWEWLIISNISLEFFSFSFLRVSVSIINSWYFYGMIYCKMCFIYISVRRHGTIIICLFYATTHLFVLHSQSTVDGCLQGKTHGVYQLARQAQGGLYYLRENLLHYTSAHDTPFFSPPPLSLLIIHYYALHFLIWLFEVKNYEKCISLFINLYFARCPTWKF